MPRFNRYQPYGYQSASASGAYLNPYGGANAMTNPQAEPSQPVAPVYEAGQPGTDYSAVTQAYADLTGLYGNFADLVRQQPLPADTSQYETSGMYEQTMGQLRGMYDQMLALQQRQNDLYDPNLGAGQMHELQSKQMMGKGPRYDDLMRSFQKPVKRSQTVHMYGYTG